MTGQDDDVDNPNDQRTLSITPHRQRRGLQRPSRGEPGGSDGGGRRQWTTTSEPKVADFGVTLSKAALAMMEGARDSYDVSR